MYHICRCRPGYSGATCVQNDCKEYCFFGGICKVGASGVYCECTNGSNEKRCMNDMTTAAASSDGRRRSLFTRMAYAIMFISALCVAAFALYILVRRGYMRQLIDKIGRSSPSNATSSFRFGNISFTRNNNAFTRFEDEQPITNLET